jgi:succinyl-diaminopimelate desuccinylase
VDGIDMNWKSIFTPAQEKEVINICRELVRIKSINPPGDELSIAEFITHILKKVGLEVELIRHSQKRASVLARLKGNCKGSAVLYNGHLDTVPTGVEKWIYDPFSAKISNGKIWGLGASDMKGGLAAMIVSIKRLAEINPKFKGDLIFAATASEETDSLGAIEIASRLKSDSIQVVVLSEPSNNEMVIAEKGALWLEIATKGKTAHGSMPESGRNAIMSMIKFINELMKIKIPFIKHPLLGSFTLSINTILGGVKTNVVPDRCVITIDMRTLPGQNHKVIFKKVNELIKEIKQRLSDFRASIKIINNRAPLETSLSEPVVKKFTGVLFEINGRRPIPKGVNYYTDATVFIPFLKVPMIIFGPGNPQLAHQPNEHIEISKLIEASKIYILTAMKLLQ